MPSFTPQALRAVVSLIVAPHGQPAEETEEVADHLVRANLAGHDSHGVGMLPAYVRLLQDGLLVPNQTPHTVLDAGALLVIDARRGFGQRMTADAVRRAIARARELGACVLALRNASHVGRIGTYGELAASAGCAFTAFVNVADGRDAQAPWACAEPRLGTNPFCTAVPGPDGPALMLDMATTTIAAGKARVAYNKGVPVPDDCLIDADRPADQRSDGVHPRPHRRDAVVRPAQGLRPGGDVRDHGRCDRRRAAGRTSRSKGGILNSMLATVIDLSRLGDPDAIAQDIEATKAHIRTSRAAPGFEEVLLPGEPERRASRERDSRRNFGGRDDVARHSRSSGEARHRHRRDRSSGGCQLSLFGRERRSGQ